MPSAANSSMTPSSSVSSLLSRRAPDTRNETSASRAAAQDAPGRVHDLVLWILPAMTTCATPSRLKQRIIRPSWATPAQ